MKASALKIKQDLKHPRFWYSIQCIIVAEWNQYNVFFPRCEKAETYGKYLDFCWLKASEQLLFIYLYLYLSAYLLLVPAAALSVGRC